jgi:hypothetical protein
VNVEARIPIRIMKALSIAALVLCGLPVGCAHEEFFPNSTILKTDENQKIIDTIETYRKRLLERNAEGLIILASEKYFEDSGTPRSDDDYGYEGLKQVVAKRLGRVKSVRFDIEYRSIKHSGNRAEVEVFLDGSFELSAPDAGDRYRRVNDYHHFVLERNADKWKFISGM